MKYTGLEEGDYCPLFERCVGEKCECNHFKDDGCTIYFKTDEK